MVLVLGIQAEGDNPCSVGVSRCPREGTLPEQEVVSQEVRGKPVVLELYLCLGSAELCGGERGPQWAAGSRLPDNEPALRELLCSFEFSILLSPPNKD